MSTTKGATDGFRPSTDGSYPLGDEYDPVAYDAQVTREHPTTRHPAEYLPVQGNK